MDEETKKELERQVSLYKVLVEREDFRTWRDLVAKPELDKIRAIKRSCMEQSEANLKATILYETYIEDLFYKMFEV